MRRRVAAVPAGRTCLSPQDSVPRYTVLVGSSQASAGLRSGDDTDTRSPARSSVIPTRHAKVGAQGASPQPRLSRVGPGKCVHHYPPSCLLEGAGGSGPTRQGRGRALEGGPFLSSWDRDSFSHVLV